ncbi:MAG: hypothetical protein JO307_27845 [Bryobacterales bacterium]|nr:hypothetical protein [Bryobacterales bacterium]
MENEGARETVLSDEYLRTHTVGKLKPLSEPIVLVDYTGPLVNASSHRLRRISD